MNTTMGIGRSTSFEDTARSIQSPPLNDKKSVRTFRKNMTIFIGSTFVFLIAIGIAILLLKEMIAWFFTSGNASDTRIPHEIWITDQASNSLAIFSHTPIANKNWLMEQQTIIDFTKTATTLCIAYTGSVPLRPRNVSFNRVRSHAIVTFLESGHVLFIDAQSRNPVSCIKIGASANAAYATPDSQYVIATDKYGKTVQRIITDYTNSVFTLDSAAALNLVTCTTPDGTPCQDPTLRPNNQPMCSIILPATDVPSADPTNYAAVTLVGGGLFVIDMLASPMRVLTAYNSSSVVGGSCGFAISDNNLFLSAASNASSMWEGFVYSLTLSALRSQSQPVPQIVSYQPGETSHGGVKLFHTVWFSAGAENKISVIDSQTNKPINTILISGRLANDPSPDRMARSPDMDFAYVVFRGQTPEYETSPGSSPGFGILSVENFGRSGYLQGVMSIQLSPNSDPYGIAVRDFQMTTGQS